MTEFLVFLGKYGDFLTALWMLFLILWIFSHQRRIARLEDRMFDKEDDA